MPLFALAIFLSAFLLFQVQPIIAKILLPWFGGSSAVWTTCMLFFQLVLLAGYAYAHWLNALRARLAQAGIHTALLALSLATLPILPRPAWKPTGSENPSWLLLGLLALTVGLPYFLLSSTSPLLQAWFASTRSRAMPYRLFAVSNFASMLALLSYPPLVEPNLTTRAQARLWSLGYAVFTILCAAIAFAAARRPAAAASFSGDPAALSAPAPPWPLRIFWMALAACASTLLLAITTFLTQDVAAIPFLWIVPLAVYLLSFIVCFEFPRLYWRPALYSLLVPALAAAAWFIREDASLWPIWPVIAATCACLFVFCMVCHGELAALKPDPRYLTGFYLAVALGGAAGGVFVGLIAPQLFRAYYEFPIGLGACATLAVLALARRAHNPAATPAPWKRLAVALTLASYLVFLAVVMRDLVKDYRIVVRNFYGRLAVMDDPDLSQPDAARGLFHGAIEHGEQSLHPEYRRTPTSYYCTLTGVAAALRALPAAQPHRIGMLGLGTGTLAAYGRAGDTIRIYEINPLVVQLARTEFTYLRDTPARVEIALGDARLSLEREPPQNFDLLAVDAFSGDSIPVHLITREAFGDYFRHLKPGGILAVHISNLHLDLRPVVERAAAAFGKVAILFEYDRKKSDLLCDTCSWIVVVDPAARSRLPGLDAGHALEANLRFREWTDDYSTLRIIMR